MSNNHEYKILSLIFPSHYFILLFSPIKHTLKFLSSIRLYQKKRKLCQLLSSKDKNKKKIIDDKNKMRRRQIKERERSLSLSLSLLSYSLPLGFGYFPCLLPFSCSRKVVVGRKRIKANKYHFLDTKNSKSSEFLICVMISTISYLRLRTFVLYSSFVYPI